MRDKWFAPEFDYENNKFSMTHFQSLDYAFGKDGEKVEEYDTVGFVSFDRRDHRIHFKYKEEDDSEKDFNYLQDRFLAEDIRNFLRAEPITRERVDECVETFREHFTLTKSKIIHQQDANNVDVKLNDKIIEPYGITSYDFLQNEHHLLHAFSVLYQSPFKDALILVCDGGGAKFFHDQFPNYQEMESMFYLSEQDITPLYKHLSNSRAVVPMDIGTWDSEYFSHLERFGIDDLGFDVELSSDLSEGQKFSALSALLGYDQYGRER